MVGSTIHNNIEARERVFYTVLSIPYFNVLLFYAQTVYLCATFRHNLITKSQFLISHPIPNVDIGITWKCNPSLGGKWNKKGWSQYALYHSWAAAATQHSFVRMYFVSFTLHRASYFLIYEPSFHRNMRHSN